MTNFDQSVQVTKSMLRYSIQMWSSVQLHMCNDKTIKSSRMCPTTQCQRIDICKIAYELYFIAHS